MAQGIRGDLVFLSSREIRLELDSPPSSKLGKITLIQVLGKQKVSDIMTIDFDPFNIFHTFAIDDYRIFDVYSYEYAAKIIYGNGEEVNVKLRVKERKPNSRIRGVAKKVKRDFKIACKRLNGSVVHIFKKMKLEEKCLECWDSDLDSSNNSSCSVCGGLGRVSYYSNPIKTYAGAVITTGDALTMSNVGQVGLSGSTHVSMLQDVSLFTDDIFFYHSTGKWFIVNSVAQQSTVKNIPTLQTLVISELPTGSTQIDTALKQGKLSIEDNKDF